MNEVALRKSSEVTVFEPAESATKDAKLTAVIEYAKRVKDWPLLEQAVDMKIEEQTELVQWGADNVTTNKGGDRRSKDQTPRSALLVEDAEKLTGISHQQVSRIKKRLKDIQAYRAKLYGKAWAEAFGNIKPHVSNNSGENEWYTPP